MGWNPEMTAAGRPPTTLREVTQDIIGLIESETAGAAGTLTADSDLQDAGMDSARVLSLVFRIEARYDIDLDAEDGDDLRTIGELAQLVLRRIQERA
jgi:acyl carrier protein